MSSVVPETEMESYLAEILTASDKSYNGGSIAEEFKTRINQMLTSGEIELVRNSSMNDCYGSSGTEPIIFNDDQWLYIPAETFATICEKLTLSNTVGSVRKAIHSAGWLRTSEDNMTYKVTLHDIRYHEKRQKRWYLADWYFSGTAICDTAHSIHYDGVETIMVDKGADSADFRLVNLIQKGDIAIRTCPHSVKTYAKECEDGK